MKYLLLLTLLFSGCCLYRMPDPDEFSTVPMTNNPMVTRERLQGPIPGLGPR